QEDEVVKHIHVDDIHRSNVCYSIQKDLSGDFWVATNFGLVKISLPNYSLKNYNLENGLDFLEYNTACVVAKDDGSLVFGGVGGITIFNPFNLLDNSYSPDPIITSVGVNGGFISTHGSEKFTFNHKENLIT